MSQKPSAGVVYQNLNVFGFDTPTDYQKTFSNYPLAFLIQLGALFGSSQNVRKDILRNCEGVLSSGEMLLVLGRPGSGCTTLLKSLAGETHGFRIDHTSEINYQGNSISRHIWSV